MTLKKLHEHRHLFIVLANSKLRLTKAILRHVFDEFINSSNFPKSLVGNNHILKQLKKFSQISKDVLKSFSENISTQSDNDLTRIGGHNRRLPNITASPSPVSTKKYSGHFTTSWRSHNICWWLQGPTGN